MDPLIRPISLDVSGGKYKPRTPGTRLQPLVYRPAVVCGLEHVPPESKREIDRAMPEMDAFPRGLQVDMPPGIAGIMD